MGTACLGQHKRVVLPDVERSPTRNHKKSRQLSLAAQGRENQVATGGKIVA